MASTQVNPTRMELTRLKKKLVTATKGHKLLKDKRDELMRQFLDLVRENMALREKVEAGIRAANTNFVIAKAGMSEETLHAALMAPKQEVYLETSKKNVMSVDVPVFEYKTRTADANDIYSYGFAFTSSDLDDAVKSLADILPDMLRLSEIEKACQLMAAEIEKKAYNSLDQEIPSSVIGEMVMEGLKNLDQVAYIRFASVYRQFRDVTTFMQFIEQFEERIKNEK